MNPYSLHPLHNLAATAPAAAVRKQLPPMAPPGSSVDLKKAKKSNSKEARKHKKDKHEGRTADELPQHNDDAQDANRSKRKHKDGQPGKEHSSKSKKGEAEAVGSGAAEVKRGDEKMRRAMEDERFAAARTDPRFRPMRRKEAKVSLDSRFSGMLTDPMFASSEAPVDKRGRRLKKGARENPMLHYYRNQENEEEQEKENKEKGKLIEDEEDDVEEDEEQDEEESSSSDDDEDEDNDDDDDKYSVGSDIAHYLMARHDDTPMIYKETRRLAVVNMDWDHIKAVDLYMVMTSCVPKGGRVLSVSIYPSEFGLKCLKVESTQGPSALVGANGDEEDNDYDDGKDDDDGEDDDEEDGGNDDVQYDSETENNKLRTYELNRLRYYHAVVVCDSSATANHLYTNLDGTEFLKTANVFDLQFIPDSMDFKHPARDVATEAPPSYKVPDFETRALQHSRVKLTWDDDEPERKKVLRRKFKDDKLDELGVYLASDDSATDDDESLPNSATEGKLTRKERLALLLQRDNSDEEQIDDRDMEITFNTELEDLSKRILDRKSTIEKTVWEKHREKMKEKRKSRKMGSKDDNGYNSEDVSEENDDFFDDEKSDEEVKPSNKQKVNAKDKGKGKGNDKLPKEHFEPEATREELELLVAADQDAANCAKGYNLKRKSKKGKKGKEAPDDDKLREIDLSKDERFSAMFTSHLFALDPTDPQYKRSAAFMRKQTGKQGAHPGRIDTESPMEKSSLGSTLPPDEACAKSDKQKPDGPSMEKLQMMSAAKSLKRKLAAFNSASASDRL